MNCFCFVCFSRELRCEARQLTIRLYVYAMGRLRITPIQTGAKLSMTKYFLSPIRRSNIQESRATLDFINFPESAQEIGIHPCSGARKCSSTERFHRCSEENREHGGSVTSQSVSSIKWNANKARTWCWNCVYLFRRFGQSILSFNEMHLSVHSLDENAFSRKWNKSIIQFNKLYFDNRLPANRWLHSGLNAWLLIVDSIERTYFMRFVTVNQCCQCKQRFSWLLLTGDESGENSALLIY